MRHSSSCSDPFWFWDKYNKTRDLWLVFCFCLCLKDRLNVLMSLWFRLRDFTLFTTESVALSKDVKFLFFPGKTALGVLSAFPAWAAQPSFSLLLLPPHLIEQDWRARAQPGGQTSIIPQGLGSCLGSAYYLNRLWNLPCRFLPHISSILAACFCSFLHI